jgi:uncharacterized protein YgiM (DUF1202 family)
MKFNQILVAAVFAVGASQAALADNSYPHQSYQPSTSTLTRAEVLADLQLYRQAGLDALNRGDNIDPTSTAQMVARSSYAQLRTPSNYAEAPSPGVTRAEILADLQIYRESGLETLNRGDNIELNSAAQVAAQARYAQLRSSPAYAALVEHFTAQRG